MEIISKKKSRIKYIDLQLPSIKIMKIALYSLFSFSIIFSTSLHYFEHSSQLAHVPTFTFISFWADLMTGSSMLYTISVLIFFPIILCFDEMFVADYGIDRMILIRSSYREFYLTTIKKVFFGGVAKSLYVSSITLFTLFLLKPSSPIFLINSEIATPMIQNIPALISAAITLLIQAFGVGILSIVLFTFTRHKPSRYLFSFSLLLVSVISLTGTAALLSFLRPLFLKYPFVTELLTSTLSIANPLSIIFPPYVSFSTSLSGPIRMLFTTLFYIVLTYILLKATFRKETR